MDVRDVRLARDERVVAEPDELGVLGFWPISARMSFGRAVEPDPALVVDADDEVVDGVRVEAEERRGLDGERLVERDREAGQRDAGDLAQDLRDDVVEEAEDVAAVGQQRDREAGLGDDPQERRLADRAAVVADARWARRSVMISHPRPHAAPMPVRRGSATCVVRMARADSRGQHRACRRRRRRSARCIATKPTRSRGRIASIEPAGSFDLASAQIGAAISTPSSPGPT